MNELVEHIAETLSIPSPEAKTRIARELNMRYKQVTTAIGLIPSRREEFSTLATIGSRLIAFTGAEKLDVVFRKVGTQNVILGEVTNDEMLDLPLRDEPPTAFSIFNVAPTTITIKIDCTPTTAFTIYAHGLGDATTLSSNDQPAFPESFHDILVHGVKADEYRRKEKDDKAKEAEAMFMNRLSDLKMFIAKSAYLDIYRGKHAGPEGWWDWNK
jgi:hypothetical protein